MNVRIYKTVRLMAMIVVAWTLSCGEASNEFQAPFGSTVTAPGGGDFKTATSIVVKTAFQVLLPDNKPASNVQLSFICAGCSILDTNPPGDAGNIQDLSLLVQMSNPYIVHTDMSGGYIVWVLLPAPATTDGYTATISGDVGVNGGAQAEFTVSLPE